MNMDQEQVEIEWKQFGEGFVSDLWKFYNSSEFSDVTISTEDGQEIKSHRILLAMCSVYFRDLFKRHKGPGHIICLSNMHSSIVRKIFALIYTGIVSIAPSMVNDFVKAAKYLKLQGFDDITSDIDDHDAVRPNGTRTNLTPNLARPFHIKLTRLTATVQSSGGSDMSPGMNAFVSSTNPVANDKFFPSTDSSDASSADEMGSQNSDAMANN
ncbi:protein tramtrack, beta isoform-like [Contarinia nasturtii]|uniref:protein tramtrack, beta isoform-like n=1 Tax=Contarinia nasturtii TaxID=265458 RepID=UPI0012D38A2A|nr:protein tramtrack, beta isoform-like [Contarinia nasturtii]